MSQKKPKSRNHSPFWVIFTPVTDKNQCVTHFSEPNPELALWQMFIQVSDHRWLTVFRNWRVLGCLKLSYVILKMPSFCFFLLMQILSLVAHIIKDYNFYHFPLSLETYAQLLLNCKVSQYSSFKTLKLESRFNAINYQKYRTNLDCN